MRVTRHRRSTKTAMQNKSKRRRSRELLYQDCTVQHRTLPNIDEAHEVDVRARCTRENCSLKWSLYAQDLRSFVPPADVNPANAAMSSPSSVASSAEAEVEDGVVNRKPASDVDPNNLEVQKDGCAEEFNGDDEDHRETFGGELAVDKQRGDNTYENFTKEFDDDPTAEVTKKGKEQVMLENEEKDTAIRIVEVEDNEEGVYVDLSSALPFTTSIEADTKGSVTDMTCELPQTTTSQSGKERAVLEPQGYRQVETSLDNKWLYTFFRFCAERHKVHERREENPSLGRDELSDDVLLRTGVYGNVFRELDRGSIYFREQIMGKGDQSHEEICCE